MAVGLVIEVSGAGQAEYDAAMKELGLDSPDASWPEGVISHFAGPMDGGWCVVDIWESKQAFDRFMTERLGAAMQKAGIPQPQIREFEVYNMHHERAAVS